MVVPILAAMATQQVIIPVSVVFLGCFAVTKGGNWLKTFAFTTSLSDPSATAIKIITPSESKPFPSPVCLPFSSLTLEHAVSDASPVEAHIHICQTYSLIRLHEPGLPFPPNFYDYLSLSPNATPHEVFERVQAKTQPLLKKQTREGQSESAKQRQVQIVAIVGAGHVLMGDTERSVYLGKFLGDVENNGFVGKKGWDVVDAKCTHL